MKEAERFFEQVLDFDYKKKDDVLAFRKVMKILDPEKKLKIYREKLMSWFESPNFLDQIHPEEKLVYLDFTPEGKATIQLSSAEHDYPHSSDEG